MRRLVTKTMGRGRGTHKASDYGKHEADGVKFVRFGSLNRVSCAQKMKVLESHRSSFSAMQGCVKTRAQIILASAMHSVLYLLVRLSIVLPECFDASRRLKRGTLIPDRENKLLTEVRSEIQPKDNWINVIILCTFTSKEFHLSELHTQRGIRDFSG
jgi:hypothetical protein